MKVVVRPQALETYRALYPELRDGVSYDVDQVEKRGDLLVFYLVAERRLIPVWRSDVTLMSLAASEILDVLTPEPMRVRDLAWLIRDDRRRTWRSLQELCRRGMAKRCERGMYATIGQQVQR